MIGVLILIYQDMFEAHPISLAHLWEALQELDRLHDDVIEVNGVGLDQTLLIERVDLGDHLFHVILR